MTDHLLADQHAPSVPAPAMVVALLDGSLVSSSAPLLRPDDAGVARGDGIFETTLVVNGEPRDLPEHLGRMAVSAAMTEIDLPDHADWQRGVDAVLDAWTGAAGTGAPAADMVLRLIATRGPEHGRPTCFVTGAAVSPASTRQRTGGVRVLLLDRGLSGPAAAAAPWLLAGAKTLSYAINMAALRYAAAHQADDVIFVGSDGAILEAPTATVVVVRDGTLLTPPLEGVLAGITVDRLFRAAGSAGWTTAHQRLTPEDLSTADGVWLASSVRLLAPVVSINGVPRDDDEGLTEKMLGLLDFPLR